MTETTSRPPFAVEVVRSARRKRTVGAQLVGSVLTVTVPSWMSRADEAKWVEEMTRRFVRRSTAEGVDLSSRAAQLAKRYDLPVPRSIKWVETMQSRWASCTPATGAIRVSSRVAAFPDWVRDYVIVHELAHLKVADHSANFWRLVERYPRTERARGYLIAKSGDEETC
jgi:predicted metal-dependent hydrolase